MVTTQSPVGLEDLDATLKADDLVGQWLFEPMLTAATGGPRSRGVGHVWPWETTRRRLFEASEALGPAGAGRCNIGYVNPGMTQVPSGTTHTVYAGVQVMRAHEVCWSHRHSMSALRFVIEGNEAAYTAVDGEALSMGQFDLLITPRFSWHDHHNPTDSDVVWLDVLDVGLVGALAMPMYETFGSASQPLRPDEATSQALRMRSLKPTWERPRESRLPVRYPWSEVEEVLAAYGDTAGSPYDGLALRYANPVTGGPTMSTMDCWVQQLTPGFEGLRHRRTSSTVGHVIEGHARIEVEGTVLEVGPGDGYAIPNFAWHRVSNPTGERTRLFTVNDMPALQALGLFYEEPVRTQAVESPPPVPGIPNRPVYRNDALLELDELR